MRTGLSKCASDPQARICLERIPSATGVAGADDLPFPFVPASQEHGHRPAASGRGRREC
jgi:hypothetical protein